MIDKWHVFLVFCCCFIIMIMVTVLVMNRNALKEQTEVIEELRTEIAGISAELKLIEFRNQVYMSPIDNQILNDMIIRKIMDFSNPKLTETDKHQYIKTITENAERVGISPILIAAIIHRESNFRKNLTSNVDARGPMQVHLPSHKKRLKKQGLKGEDLYTIEHGISIGSDILKEYLDKSDGNYRKALACYVGVKKNYKTSNKYIRDIFNTMKMAYSEF